MKSRRTEIQIAMFLVLFQLPFSVCAQLVAFSGKNSQPDDNFAFVALQNIPMGTFIYFTNRAWDNFTGAFLDDGEGTLLFVATEKIPVGKVIEIVEPNSPGNTFHVSSSGIAVIVGTINWSVSTDDPHYAFSAFDANSPTNSVNEVYAFFDTREGTQAGTSVDPTFFPNASPDAVVCDWTNNQPVSIDYSLDRSDTTVESLGDCSPPTFIQLLTPINLENFVFDLVFRNGFE